MCRCWLCGPVSHNEADFEVSYGVADRILRVCRWCEQDLQQLGFRANQIVRLPKPQRPRSISLAMLVFGPIYTFLEVKA